MPKAPKGIPREHPNAASSHMGDRCVAATSLRCCGGTPGDQDGRGTNELSKIESILGTRMSQNLSRDRRLACPGCTLTDAAGAGGYWAGVCRRSAASRNAGRRTTGNGNSMSRRRYVRVGRSTATSAWMIGSACIVPDDTRKEVLAVVEPGSPRPAGCIELGKPGADARRILAMVPLAFGRPSEMAPNGSTASWVHKSNG